MRRSVSLLIVAGLLPVVGLGGTFGAITFRNERKALERQASADAHFAAALIGVKLQSHVDAIGMIAQSPALDDDVPDLARFGTLSARVTAQQRDWRTISLADAGGNRIIDVPQPTGGLRGGRVVEPNSFRRAVVTGRPQIGDVVMGPKRGRAFAVRAPIARDGHVRYVVSAVIPAAQLRKLLVFDPLPEGWSAAVLDAQGQVVVASDRSHPAGRAAVESWAAVPNTGWRVRVSIPGRAFSEPVRNAALSIALAALLCLALLVLLARMLAAELKALRQREAVQLQGQRMEALGRLTGGIAHDLNNLLTPIVGGLDLIRHRVSEERTLRYVDAAALSADRAKTLVSRLLSFSRRQSLAPRATDVGRLIAGMSDLLDRSLTPAIRLEVAVTPGLCAAHVDQGQLELALLNLVINARDAMAVGGEVRIEARPATAAEAKHLARGNYIALAVHDTGTGMDAATMRQAIDPFFTTKPADKGTGLGLSMVHGFAAQSGGELLLASTLGQGTTATIVLPCSSEPLEDGVTTARERPLPPGRVLLVDDEVAVRETTAQMLRDAGQRVVQASSVDEALTLLRRDDAFDAVVTDYVMPTRSGAELVTALRAEWPHIPALIVTGYVTIGDELPSDAPRLMKPFSSEELLQALARLRVPR